jgi:hypothetical protein
MGHTTLMPHIFSGSLALAPIFAFLRVSGVLRGELHSALDDLRAQFFQHFNNGRGNALVRRGGHVVLPEPG